MEKERGKVSQNFAANTKKPVDPVVSVDLKVGLDNTDNTVYRPSEDFIEQRKPNNNSVNLEADPGVDF